MKLKISEHLSLPVDVVTQTIAVLAKRRAGKSYLMRRLVEQLFAAGQQVVLVDPKGDQWGVRSAADGKGPGLSVVILGGERGDVPLEAGSGDIVAKLVVEERVSVVLDLSLFRKHEVATFMTGFLETLYRLKAREVYRTPLMLVMDEADAIAPQKPQKGEERMLGAAEDIVRRGGQRGIGCVLVTQRSAVLNKNLLTQAQVMIALRTIAPQDLAAMNAWIDVHGTFEQRQTLMESLPSLPVGDAWVWSPGWPTVDGIFKRVHVLPIETFDSGATPKPGETRIDPKAAADVDLGALRRQMSATIEKSKANDPKLLRARIAELELERKPDAGPTPAWRAEYEDAYVRDTASAHAAGKAEGWNEAVAQFEPRLRTAGMAIEDAQRIARMMLPPAPSNVPQTYVNRRTLDIQPRPAQPMLMASAVHAGNGQLPKSERLILTALAQYRQGRSKVQVAVLTGYAKNGGSFNNSLGALRTRGWIEGRGENITITSAGLEALGDYQPLPTGKALLDHWQAQLGKAERSVLSALAAVYPKALSKTEIGARAGYEPNGGSFNNALGKLRTLELIVGRGEIRATDNLF